MGSSRPYLQYYVLPVDIRTLWTTKGANKTWTSIPNDSPRWLLRKYGVVQVHDVDGQSAVLLAGA